MKKMPPLHQLEEPPDACTAASTFRAVRRLRFKRRIRRAGYEKELGQIDLHVRALTELCHLYGSDMAKRKSGKILNVVSTAAFQPGPWMSVYYATKSYVLHFSEGIAEELKQSGVQVSALCPGPTVTEFADTAGMDKSLLFQLKAAEAGNCTLCGAIRGGKIAQRQTDYYTGLHEPRGGVWQPV
jgi:NAD(P)-dependent dehydrogenase (short-subunit alcohol dehydrogenase family)